MKMPTIYQLNQIKQYLLFALLSLFLIILTGNIISYFFTKKITINPKAYIIKDGYPIFISEADYIEFIRNYPFNPGVELTIYKISAGETLWSLRKKFNVTIDTLIAANPHLKGLDLTENSTIIIPSKNGALFTFDDYRDVGRMYSMMGSKNKILGDYKPKIFRIISPDDIRLVFFEKGKPMVVNNDIQKIYAYKMTFIDPLDSGFYTSMYGDRVNPVFGENVEFHNGVDIATKNGTPIKSVRDGLVFFSGWREGFGNTIIIQHDDGYATFYAHCSKLLVKQGQWVNQGDQIAAVGSTGRSTGSHLHFTVIRHGKLLNPFKYLW
ncbi:MAG TPA: LysM peptidoglycan-binding domain-containing M23 family metallopeptidase [Spirochaetota bacterium]|nr:LysM peptidoglycan-binding domain-containing M23 family metallopeptidase [Spirochaetota bacterium]HPS86369.1 LysM peptidoglycan-binding domain-containing M23 family metallopeptidase [Spirochaetota bacterium]